VQKRRAIEQGQLAGFFSARHAHRDMLTDTVHADSAPVSIITSSSSEVQGQTMGLQERTGSDELPTRIVVRHCAMALDGGTIHLIATDEAGRQVSIMLAALLPSSSMRVAGRLYFDGNLVPMRSEREAGILKLLSEATVESPRLPPPVQESRMVVIGQDIKSFLEQTAEENCKAFIRKILQSVQSESYLRLVTDEEKALADEANHDEWERPSGKKKRRTWRRGR
jgi:hypothetical protein